MDNYMVYILISSAAIATPGPGVVLSISNAIKYGVRGALVGILGVASGMFVIATISATSLAAAFSASMYSFTILKYLGAAYLTYLGLKMWFSTSNFKIDNSVSEKSNQQKFIEGFLITLLNPKAIFFFMALFPHFITSTKSYLIQFTLLALTFCCLLIIIHLAYAYSAKSVKTSLFSHKGTRLLNVLSGSFYIIFGFALAFSNQ